MTLNANEPTDQRLVSELPYYIRQGRAALNAHIASNAHDYTVTDLAVAAGATALDTDIDMTDIWIEHLFTSGVGAATIEYLRGARHGQVKVFHFMNNLVSFQDRGTLTGGTLYLNQLPADSIMTTDAGDVIALVNINGNPDAAISGYWRELWREIAVK